MPKARYKCWIGVTVLLITLLSIFSALSLSVGEFDVRLTDILAILSKKSGIEYIIISKIRIPRLILGISVGAILGLSGMLLQAVYRNPIAESSTLGISSGAVLGFVACVLFPFLEIFDIYSKTIVCCFTALIFVYYYQKKLNFNHLRNVSNKIIFNGLVVTVLCSFISLFVFLTSSSYDSQEIFYIIFGALNQTNAELVYLTAGTALIYLILGLYYRKKLNYMIEGVEYTQEQGVNVAKMTNIILYSSTVAIAIVTSVAGHVVFVGVVVPFILKAMIIEDYRINILSSALGGAVFVVAIDVIAKSAIPQSQSPLSVVGGIFGAAIILYLYNSSNETSD